MSDCSRFADDRRTCHYLQQVAPIEFRLGEFRLGRSLAARRWSDFRLLLQVLLKLLMVVCADFGFPAQISVELLFAGQCAAALHFFQFDLRCFVVPYV